jgi:hypothetical protein
VSSRREEGETSELTVACGPNVALADCHESVSRHVLFTTRCNYLAGVPAQPQPQPPPQQPPELALGAGPDERDAPVRVSAEISFTVSWWPTGQVAGSPAALIGRLTSKTAAPPSWAQSRQRNS